MFKKSRFACIVCSGLLVLSCAGASSANDVQVAIEGSLLTVFGDNLGNSIAIEESETGLLITGRAGTTINGLPSVSFPGAILNAAEIRMEGGNDVVSLSGLSVSNDLYVSLGEGNDSLSNSSTIMVGGNLTVETGAGNDSVAMNSVMVFEDTYIDGGLGILQASVAGSILQKSLTVISDQAVDTLTISSTEIAEMLLVETKGGNDTISVSSVSAFGISIASDAGADTVSLSGIVTLEDVGVFTGIGNDVVTLTSLASGKSITVSVDAGNDTVAGTSVTASFDAIFEGGAGRDIITDTGIFGGTKKDIKEFEVRR